VKGTTGTTRRRNLVSRALKLKVGIIGAGVAGLSSAILLKKFGCEVTVFEKKKRVSTEGAGVQITSNGLFVLEQIDLYDKATNCGINPDNLCFYDTDSLQKIGKLEILDRMKKRYGKSFVSLRRALLIKILFEKVKSEKIEVNFGVNVHPLFKKGQQDFSIIYDGKDIKKDLIVVADGVNSTWKKVIFSEIKKRIISQTAYRMIINKKNLPAIFSENNINLFFGGGKHFVSYPTGRNGMINFVFCKREKGQVVNSWKEKVTKDQFLQDFDLPDALKKCFSNVKKIYKWPIIESAIPLTIRKKNVVMVGDAAHGMLPYMAQGANKALEDSWELAKCIERNPENLELGIQNYSKKRINRIRGLDRVARLNEIVYHLELRILRELFFLFLRCVTKLCPNAFFKRLDWVYNHKGE
jgi:salicylate hydroxylase